MSIDDLPERDMEHPCCCEICGELLLECICREFYEDLKISIMEDER